ncbi:MAG: OmpA family protein [Planctomycetaceae bacterium]|nr:OmpA family protein [Planctomycetaceae bacterium]
MSATAQRRAALAALAVCALLAAAGCRSGAFQPPPNATTSTGNAALPQQTQALATQVQDLNRRVAQLDLNNADLHRQLAQKAQQETAAQEQVALLQKELGSIAQRYKDSQLAQQQAQQKVTALEASTRFRGGASISANSSVKQSLAAVSIPGLDIRQDGELIRIEIPADKLFAASSPQIQSNGQRIMDEVAAAIARSYPRQRIVIEGHTDDSFAGNPAAAHALAGQQAQAVFSQLVERGRLPARQLSVLAMGDNHPLASNATPAGKAKNRRIEIVVYPDSL